MIYFAYGSNLNIERMKSRCRDAVPLGKFALRESRLVFRGVADCVYAPGSRCWGALWRISRADEDALDSCEGNGVSYHKEFIDLKGFPGEKELMLYVMNSTGIFPPSETYLATVRSGYRQFKLPMVQLDEALRSSWANKNPSHRERQRYARTGRPRLAQAPKESPPATLFES